MKRALVFENNVIQVEDQGQDFPVAKPMTWVDCPDDCEVGWKIYEGELVEKTPAEIAVELEAEAQEITDHIGVYADQFETGLLSVDEFEENFTESNRRNLKEAVDLLRELNAPDTTTIKWNSVEYGVQDVSLSVMVAWLIEGGQKRQTRFIIEPALRTLHETTPFTSKEAIETKFNQEYDKL